MRKTRNGIYIPGSNTLPRKRAEARQFFLDEKRRELTIDGVRFSLDLLLTLAAPGEKLRGPFWIGREEDTICIYEPTDISPPPEEETNDGN